jgi:hypothetical protein
MHHCALILPPIPPLTKKHRQAAATSGHRGRSEAAATFSCSCRRRPIPCSRRHRRSLLLPPPPRMRGGEGDSGPNLKPPKPNSEPPSPDFLLPTAATPLFKICRPPPSPYPAWTRKAQGGVHYDSVHHSEDSREPWCAPQYVDNYIYKNICKIGK